MTASKLTMTPSSSLTACSNVSPTSTISLESTSQHDTKVASSISEFFDATHAPHSRFACLLIAHIGAALALFLATTDATIVSTSLPTIAADLKASPNQYSWVGVSYMLTQTACQPIYPPLSRLIGRKAVLFCSIFIFILGSTLCGAAKSIIWLIVTRSVQGIGAGGIVNSVWVLTGDIVRPQEKHKWSQALSATWSASAIGGPILGGVFSQHSVTLSWRWAFYMNIPVGLTALGLLYWSLRYFRLERKMSDFTLIAMRTEIIRDFDFVGVFLLISGTACTVLGFSFASQKSWTAPFPLTLLIVGFLCLAGGITYEIKTSRVAIFPPALFQSRTEVIILIISFLHNVAFNAGTFYLALYYQAALGVEPLLCGVLMLPYSLGAALASVPVAQFNDYMFKKTHDTRCYRIVIIGGLAISTLGFGLLSLLNESSNIVAREIYPLIAGVGLGMLFHAPFAALTSGMSTHDRSRATSAFFLIRFIGATSGLSIAGAVFESKLSQTMPADSPSSVASASADMRHLVNIQPVSLRLTVLHAVSTSISWIWVVCVCCLGVAFLIGFGIRIVSTVGEEEAPRGEYQCKNSVKEKIEV